MSLMIFAAITKQVISPPPSLLRKQCKGRSTLPD
uniref:Uncharacterized protein n=1 Tax=Anguilla anguilla TaxID=7936 RepID=A0A0E9VGD2_ANGAN